MSNALTLTPALSHPMGEGQSSSGFRQNATALETKPGQRPVGISRENFQTTARCYSLSHRMGEGQGEGRTGYLFQPRSKVFNPE